MDWTPSDRYAEWQGCLGCAHNRYSRCAAYPRGIPLEIISGEVDHLIPRPGQVDEIVFEEMDPEMFWQTGQRVPRRASTPAEQSA